MSTRILAPTLARRASGTGRHGPWRLQRGAFIITFVLALLFLLGFMGIALDFGRLFVIRTELQTAADSCALAAAQELDTASDALTRAVSAGRASGNLNRVQFQSSSAGITASDISFSDALNGTYSGNFPYATAKYAKCQHTQTGIMPWLLQALGAFSGNSTYGNSQSVAAVAVATRASAQTACAIPVQINPKTGGKPPNYGFATGEWIPTVYDESKSSTASPGYFGWANLDGSNSANTTTDELLGNGHCNLSTGAPVGTPGTKFSASVAWNSRFGLYKNGNGNPQVNTASPDLTGYSYTQKNWSSQSNALQDFLAKRADYRSYGDLADSINTGDKITGLNIKGGYKDAQMATHAAGANALATWGGNRRLVMAPFVVGGKIDGWACVLMLHPIDSNKTTVYLEYIANASSPQSKCTTNGLPGGGTGPLVPMLVQ
ncbi:MAG: pilus assembly protein TadG-related protein [Comamonas sp.]|jgi:hypothetical protein|uniref:pilus assembly protein TadG-related protein n=1 Tax=Comamonas sp. TaxID=34028 RepID=UPI00283389AC|nr:pilus assembly protein TadG-related protein [Comamonas sp.]MDR0216304.1 pilus assembly protein TadG-related protein [Comamonas sp.]